MLFDPIRFKMDTIESVFFPVIKKETILLVRTLVAVAVADCYSVLWWAFLLVV